jgi:hypothetical protein
MDVEEATCLVLYRRRLQRQTERHFWVRPILRDKLTYTYMDSALFKESVLYKKLVHRNLGLPQPKTISNIDTTPLAYVFIGNEAFGIMENVMRPYGGKSLTHVKKRLQLPAF